MSLEQEQQAGPRVEQEDQASAGRNLLAASLALDSELDSDLVDLAAQDISSMDAGIAVDTSGSQAKKLLHGPLLPRCPDSLQNSSASVRSG
jgi:hypothetical protein